MQELRIILIIIGLTLANVIYAQIDLTVCPGGFTNVHDPKWQMTPSWFEIVTELVDANGTIDVSQSFAPYYDVVTKNSKDGVMKSYWNFLTNETFDIVPATNYEQTRPQCVRQIIQSTSETSIIQPNRLFLKPSVLLGFDVRNQVNKLWGIQYIGDEDLHGISANIFTSCFYVNDTRTTVSATYHVSDATKSQTYLPQNISLILQISVKSINEVGYKESYQYNVLRYTPNPNRDEEFETIETPPGVFCLNRTSQLILPSSISPVAIGNGERFSSQETFPVVSSRSAYHVQYDFSRFDVWHPNISNESQLLHTTELHDFRTGLKYQYNSATGQCSVLNMTSNDTDAMTVNGKPNFIQMGSVQHFFAMDDIPYQYTGEKRCRHHVSCNVWIGEKVLPNNSFQYREWYWVKGINNELLSYWAPWKMVIKNYANDVLSYMVESNVFNFHDPLSIVPEFSDTLANCYRSLGHRENFNVAIISFIVDNDHDYPLIKNVEYLRDTIFDTLAYRLGVRPFRISNVIINFNGKDILVTFTLLDATPFLGLVSTIIHDEPLTSRIEYLRYMIDSHTLQFDIRDGSKDYYVWARNNSLRAINTGFDPNPTECDGESCVQTTTPPPCLNITTEVNQNLEIVYKNSGPLITGFWISFVVLGVLIGAVGGFFVLKRFYKR
ncbi:unnamed protein product [Rotaria sp. Silwood2]|nr:unnamed protein product [Rotaria sp. Silwood2]